MKNFCQQIHVLIVLVLTAGCSVANDAPSEEVPFHSVTYYASHPEDALRVSRLCHAMNKQKREELGEFAYEEWRISETWMRCSIAISMIEADELRKLF